MRATPTASLLHVFTEPHSIPCPSQHPPSHFLAGPCRLGRKLVPRDKAEDNEGAGDGLDRRLYRRKQPPPQGARRPSRTWPAGHSAPVGHTRNHELVPTLPGLSAAHAEWPETVPARKLAWVQEGCELPSPLALQRPTPGSEFIIAFCKGRAGVKIHNGHSRIKTNASCPTPSVKNQESATGFWVLCPGCLLPFWS